MGIKGKEFKEGSQKFLQNVFGKKLQMGIEAKLPRKTYLDPEDEKLVYLGVKPKSKVKSKSADMMLLHEAFQYLVKRKSLQVRNIILVFILSVKYFSLQLFCRNKPNTVIMELVGVRFTIDEILSASNQTIVVTTNIVIYVILQIQTVYIT